MYRIGKASTSRFLGHRPNKSDGVFDTVRRRHAPILTAAVFAENSRDCLFGAFSAKNWQNRFFSRELLGACRAGALCAIFHDLPGRILIGIFGSESIFRWRKS
jgi:hypothetical protein